jgi:hypothetical protein
MKLSYVVLELGNSRMNVVAIEGSRYHRIRIDWHTKKQTDCPPDVWPEMVEKEIALRSQSNTGLAEMLKRRKK